jgi:hypothetical protein
MAFSVQADKFRFREELCSGVAGKRVLITGAGKDGGLGQAFALSAGLNGAAAESWAEVKVQLGKPSS